MRTKDKMRIARVIARLLLAKSRPIRQVRRQDILWDLDLRETIDLSIYLTGYFQRSVIEQLAVNTPINGVVIDVGANRGSVAIQIANLVPTCKVYAIEPVVQLVNKIHQALDNNPHLKARVDVETCFLSCASDTPDMNPPKSVDASWNLFDTEGQDPISGATALPLAVTAAETLDAFVTRKGINRLDLMKLDVEGYELDVLRGGESSIKTFRPVVLMEWNPYLCGLRGVTLEDLRKFWQEHEYVTYRLRLKRPPKSVSWDELTRLGRMSHVDLLLKPAVS